MLSPELIKNVQEESYVENIENDLCEEPSDLHTMDMSTRPQDEEMGTLYRYDRTTQSVQPMSRSIRQRQVDRLSVYSDCITDGPVICGCLFCVVVSLILVIFYVFHK